MDTKSVLIGVSGGVDSAVAAYLLKEKGYRVEGLYIYNGFPNRAEDDAVRVAEKLSIPLHRIDIAGSFKKDIVDYFVAEYSAARTPNPCVVCNKKIKIHYLFNEAKKRNLDYITTGHYARIENLGGTNGLRLGRGKDRKKDQTYFLFQLGQKELSKLLLPNGGMTKDEVKQIGSDLGFGFLTERESQEICFIPDDDYRGFIEKDHNFQPGNIVTAKGDIVGKHRGIHSLTIGQRRGLNIASERPYYVLAIDKERNEVIVGRDEDQYCKGLIARNVTWASQIYSAATTIRATTHIRYRHRGAASEITVPPPVNGKKYSADTVYVRFDIPQKAIAPGQAAVFYQGDILIGGGWIVKGVQSD
ncbi:MAG: tRNA 2-thiouridine(34) synthase MnmA [Deltaproteobacteria bacterium]|nr:tRNA 2-thiouridine(34) synthase MnmA [Deltaproteobacteria bacterium]